MENFEVKITWESENKDISDILIALLSDFGFEGFIEEDNTLTAFIGREITTETDMNDFFATLPFFDVLDINIGIQEQKNWNEECEKNFFTPIKIGNRCLIRSSFHDAGEKVEYEILVDPKMSFGTGHHATTYLMVEALLDMDMKEKNVLDMGCGTGILAILAAKKACQSITAIDIDEWAYKNTLENITINKVDGIEVLLGGAELLSNQQFDVIIANINRNILLEDMHAYAQVLKPKGIILFSGFYSEDLPLITSEAAKYNMLPIDQSVKNNWTMARFEKA